MDWPAIHNLSKRQKEVLKLYFMDLKPIDIAEKLGIKVNTVEAHLNSIKQKLGCRKISELKEM